MRRRRFALPLEAIAATLILAACHGGSSDPAPQPPPIAATPPQPEPPPAPPPPDPTPPPVADDPTPPPAAGDPPPTPPVADDPPPTPPPPPVPEAEVRGFPGQWVGAFERVSALTGAVLQEQQAACWFGQESPGFGFFRLTCMLFGRRIPGEQYATDPQPLAVMDTGGDDQGLGNANASLLSARGKFFSVGPGEALNSNATVADFNVTDAPRDQPSSELLFMVRIGTTGENDWRFRGMRALPVTENATVYGPYSFAHFAGSSSASLNIALSTDPTVEPSNLFVQAAQPTACAAAGGHETHYSTRGFRTPRLFGGAALNASVQCGPAAPNEQTGFAFFGRPAFVANPAGYTGMLFFAFTAGGPASFGYALKPDGGPATPYPADDAPIAFHPIRAQAATAGSIFVLRDFQNFPGATLRNYFYDPNREALTFEATSLPSFLSLDSATGALTGTPTMADVRTAPYTVRVRAIDATGTASPTRAFDITVRAAPTGTPVLIEPIPAQTASVNNPFQLRDAAGAPTTLAAFFRDPDGDVLSYSASGLPPGLADDTATGAITGIPTTAREAAYSIQVRVTDPAGNSVLQIFNLAVGP